MNYIQYMKPGGDFNSSQWDFNKVDKSKLTPEQIKYAVELYFWRTKDPEMKKLYKLWSDYQQTVKASLKADPISDIAAASELPEVTITMAKPNYIDLIKSDIRNKWANMSTEDKVHAGINAATTIGGFIPGADVVADGVDLLHSLQRKDWTGAGIGAAAMVLPFVSAPMLRKIKTLSNTLFSPEARLARAIDKNTKQGIQLGLYYHGSPNRNISRFKTGKDGGIYFTQNRDAAKLYTGTFGTGKVYNADLDLGNKTITIDNGGAAWTKIPENKVAEAFNLTPQQVHDIIGSYNLGEVPWHYGFTKMFGYKPKNNYYAIDLVVRLGKDLGVTGLVIQNARDNGKRLFSKNIPYDQTIVFDPKLITLNPLHAADEAVLRGQLGWAPKQTIPYRHGSLDPELQTFVPKYDRWDVTTHGADPYMYFVTDQSTPVSAANMMDLRPYQYTGNIVAEKPMVQVGDFNIAGKNATRNQLIARARQLGADTYLLQDIVDNKVPHLNIVARFIGPEGEAVQGGALLQTKTTPTKTSLAFFERQPANISEAERLGISKHDRHGLGDFNTSVDWRPNYYYSDSGRRSGSSKTWELSDDGFLFSHIPEYLRIEKSSKHSGNWLKNSDGSKFEGDPRTWIMMLSKAFLKSGLYPDIKVVSGTQSHPFPINSDYDVWGVIPEQRDVAASFGYNPNTKQTITYSYTYPKNVKELIVTLPQDGIPYHSIPKKYIPDLKKLSSENVLWTDAIVNASKDNGYEVTRIQNVLEGLSDGMPVTDVIIHKGTPRKIIEGSNGEFNLKDKHPFRKSGGTIKIKKKNLGSFTRYCNGKVTEECIRKGKNSSNPTTRKRANFAWVARHKFKHEDGGKLNYLNYFN